MNNGIAEQQVNQKIALMLAYDYLKPVADAVSTGTADCFVYSVNGEKITLKDSLEAIKSCACSI